MMNTNEAKIPERVEQPRRTPATDILEMEDGFHIFMDLPGVSRQDMVIDLNEGELTVSAESSYSFDKEKVLRNEFGGGRYMRTFSLSDTVDREKIKATFKNGVLNLYLPKAEAAKPRTIQIGS